MDFFYSAVLNLLELDSPWSQYAGILCWHTKFMWAFFRYFPFVLIERKSGLEQQKGKEMAEISFWVKSGFHICYTKYFVYY